LKLSPGKKKMPVIFFKKIAGDEISDYSVKPFQGR
jgi:hypothetical protein